MALRGGINAFPRALAAGLPLKLNTQIVSIARTRGGMSVSSATGERLEGRNLVLAMALEQTMPFVAALEDAEGRDGILALLRLFISLPCLTVIAGYPRGAPVPDFDIQYPEEDHALMLLCNESSKRPGSPQVVMTYQAAPRWSRERMEMPKDQWARELVAAAARRLGSWADSPEWTHAHRWRYSRLDRANELAGPLEMRVGDSRVGIAGDLFSPGGGIQAAWLSGGKLAERLSQEPSKLDL